MVKAGKAIGSKTDKVEKHVHHLDDEERMRVLANFVIDRMLLDYKNGLARYTKVAQGSVKKSTDTN